jgi:glycogen operon protein
VRDYWRGTEGTTGHLATRLTGSSDLYQNDGRRPVASINFVTAHDGFTLRDLVSYEHKHNEANGEDNRDGEEHNRSFNCGVEGPTDDVEVNMLRIRQQRNFLATLLLSQGVPMLLAGDEVGRSQQGNNNGYCQDNELSWFDWDLGGDQLALAAFVQRLIRLRLAHPLLHRRLFFEGQLVKGTGLKDAFWIRPDGHEMDEAAWADPHAKTVGLVMVGAVIEETDRRGRPLVDDNFVLLLNAYSGEVPFVLPPQPTAGRWESVLDTARNGGLRGEGRYQPGETYALMGSSFALLRQHNRARSSLP